MNGDLDTAAGRGDLVRLALRLIVEEALEGEVADVFLDNARYHHAKIVQSGYATRTRDRAAFRPVVLPASQTHRAAVGADAPAPHPQQDLPNVSGIRHSPTPLSTFYATKSRGSWASCDSVTDNFRVVLPAYFRILA